MYQAAHTVRREFLEKGLLTVKLVSRLAAGAALAAVAMLPVAPAQADIGTGSSGGTASPTSPADDDSGASTDTATGTCSGTVDRRGFFYAHTYQYAYTSNGTVESEDHDFSFGGFLSDEEHARIIGARNTKWVIYRAKDFDLAVPYVSGAGLYLLEKRHDSDDLNNPETDFNWIKLCDY